MKRVSFEVGYAIKEAGYPQGNTDECYLTADHNQFYKKGQIVDNTEGEWTVLTKNLSDIPTYLEVWVWLWNEKNIKICVEPKVSVNGNNENIEVYILAPFYALPHSMIRLYNNPEKAIIDAIEYLTDSNLIK